MTITISKTRPAVRRADPADHTTASGVLTAAFFDDPVTDWIVPDRARRPAVLPPVFRLYFDAFQPHGETYLTEGGAGTALWLPPGRDLIPPDELEDFGRRTEEAAGPFAGRLFELDEFFEAHAPAEPHWHLQLLAVAPEQQGKGLGSALLDEVLQRLDRDREAVYLEATTLRSRALYERHGFECFGEIALPDGPTMWQMWRAPR
jgi:ribosomal protein S18 acetylase RimI-like enzyme